MLDHITFDSSEKSDASSLVRMFLFVSTSCGLDTNENPGFETYTCQKKVQAEWLEW